MITVTTDDLPDQPAMLRLKATIPQLLKVTPIFVCWSATETLSPKTITVDIGPEFPVT